MNGRDGDRNTIDPVFRQHPLKALRSPPTWPCRADCPPQPYFGTCHAPAASRSVAPRGWPCARARTQQQAHMLQMPAATAGRCCACRRAAGTCAPARPGWAASAPACAPGGAPAQPPARLNSARCWVCGAVGKTVTFFLPLSTTARARPFAGADRSCLPPLRPHLGVSSSHRVHARLPCRRGTVRAAPAEPTPPRSSHATTSTTQVTPPTNPVAPHPDCR